MAIVTQAPSTIKGVASSTTGVVDITDVATGLLTWGSINIHSLKTPSLIRRELANNEVLVTNDRPGAWSVIQAVRDKILADLGLTLQQI